MNTMMVSPLFKVSHLGPLASTTGDLVHLRQGELDGACGPYCVVSALITLGLMGRDDVLANMHAWKGSSREGRFRDALYKFGALSCEGTNGDDLQFLADHFKRVGLEAKYVEGRKNHVFDCVAEAVESGQLPIVGVQWAGGGGHWMLVVGYQGEQVGEDIQLTHLLCLNPGEEAPKASLWNSVLEVYKSDGSSIHKGSLASNFWGMDGKEMKCQIKDTFILSLASKK